jgi:hypothetical protein
MSLIWAPDPYLHIKKTRAAAGLPCGSWMVHNPDRWTDIRCLAILTRSVSGPDQPGSAIDYALSAFLLYPDLVAFKPTTLIFYTSQPKGNNQLKSFITYLCMFYNL